MERGQQCSCERRIVAGVCLSMVDQMSLKVGAVHPRSPTGCGMLAVPTDFNNRSNIHHHCTEYLLDVHLIQP